MPPKSESRSSKDIAKLAVETARKKGAQQVAAAVNRRREVEVTWRDGKLEKISEATTRSLELKLYVDGRYSALQTSDLRPEALGPFLDNAVSLTRVLAKDPARTLPDPALYYQQGGQAAVDLQIEDGAYDAVTPDERRRIARELEEGVRAVKGRAQVLSVTTGFSDTLSETVRVTSNGFEGVHRDTAFFTSAEMSVKDPDGRRPEDYAMAGKRFFAELPKPAQVGREAAERTFGRVGAKKVPSAVLPMAIDARAAGRMVSYLLMPLQGQALQQRRSFLEGKADTPVGSAKLSFSDDPHVPRGLGSRHFDSEGLAARRFPLFEGGVLRNYYVDNYYGKKLKRPPTTARLSNLGWALGDRSQAQLLSDLKEGIFVTSFIGGNSNSTTGDFSLGVQGFRVRGGRLAEPVSEMNISGNHLELWKRLVAVGNDPYAYSPLRTPTLVFDKVQFAGT